MTAGADAATVHPRPWHERLAARAGRALARVIFGRDVTAELLADRERLTAELAHRHAELFSLQELAHVLSASVRFDRVVTEVARYAMRALDASGAAVLLAPVEGAAFEVAAAKGVLAGHVHRHIGAESVGVALEAIGHERLIRRTAEGGGTLPIFEGAEAHATVVAPLRAHGVTSGAILVVDRLVGDFSDDDARLLSAAATHAAVVLANARFFELVRVGKEQWETTFDALSAGIALVDARGSIRRSNRAVADLARTPIPAIIGRDLNETLFGGQAVISELLAQATAARRPMESVRRSDPLGRMLRLLVAPLPNPTSEAAATVVVEDITEQKQLEAQLLQAEKLASVGTLVSGVAHELNNPLTSIAGLSELLLEQGVGSGPQREHLQVINDQAGRASRIVRNLLAFARKGSGERAALDLGDIAQRTMLLMNYEFQRRGITAETRAEPGTAIVLGNRDELQQVLLNLLTNAAHALEGMPEGAPRRLEVTVGLEGRAVVLRVQDTGPGITPEVATQIFDPFFTTKPPGEGTGLGLFLSYGIAETHGGSLIVDSAPGRGATFVLSLPAVTETAAPPERSAPRAAGHRILIVDDDAAAVRVVTALFGHDGHAVDAAHDGDVAVALLQAHDYDLILADLRATAGQTRWREALHERPHLLPRLALTSTDRFAAPPADLAGTRMLQKPFDLRALRETAAAIWGAV